MAAYPIVKTFNAWKFPLSIPQYWTVAVNPFPDPCSETLLNNLSAYNTSRMADKVAGRDGRYVLTSYFNGE